MPANFSRELIVIKVDLTSIQYVKTLFPEIWVIRMVFHYLILFIFDHMGIISHYSGRTLLGTWGPAFSPDGVIVAISFNFIALGGCILGELGVSVTY